MPCVCVLVLSICRSWQWKAWFGSMVWDLRVQDLGLCLCVRVGGTCKRGDRDNGAPFPSPFPRPKRCTASHANIRLRLRLRVRNPHSRLLLCTRKLHTHMPHAGGSHWTCIGPRLVRPHEDPVQRGIWHCTRESRPNRALWRRTEARKVVHAKTLARSLRSHNFRSAFGGRARASSRAHMKITGVGQGQAQNGHFARCTRSCS